MVQSNSPKKSLPWQDVPWQISHRCSSAMVGLLYHKPCFKVHTFFNISQNSERDAFKKLNWQLHGKVLQVNLQHNLLDLTFPVFFSTSLSGGLSVEWYSDKFSISPACISKIPLKPPLQKGEEAGIPGLFEKLHIQRQQGLGQYSRLPRKIPVFDPNGLLCLKGETYEY